MRLHEKAIEFNDLVILTSQFKNLNENSIKTDYDLVWILKNLSESKFKDEVVFKGGTSLSKCYDDVLKRFSEDIDLTFTPLKRISSKQIEKSLKSIEETLTGDFNFEDITYERSLTNKSRFIWRSSAENKIKLEIGYSGLKQNTNIGEIKTYIQEYLEAIGRFDLINIYKLETIKLNVFDIRQTFLDKLFAIKRHSQTGRIQNKIRHLYDVCQLWNHNLIQELLKSKGILKSMVATTKINDQLYLEKRRLDDLYISNERYNLAGWIEKINNSMNQRSFNRLIDELVFEHPNYSFKDAIKILSTISQILENLDE
jgi:predicted nucleotidyltransferase component of viral defense system